MINIIKFYGEKFHFITEYPDNKYIEKTITYICETDTNRNIIKNGKTIVCMRNGEQYEFETYATFYCSQFGIQVSDDGQYIYVISDEKGLWCYTYKGEIVWKTRYTSVSEVFPHPNNNITCILSTKLLILDNSGKIIKQVNTYCGCIPDKVSDEVIAAHKSENIVALFDSMTLEVLHKISIKKLELDYFNTMELKGNILTIHGYSIKKEAVTIQIDLNNSPAVIK